MPATMRDVASLAGVSLKTVSRVVNLEPHTRPEVVARVRAAISELGWVPNGSARTLRTGRTGMIGVAVPELRRPYHAALAEALVSEVYRRGLQAAVEPIQGDATRIGSLLRNVGRDVDGVVLLGPQDPAQLAGLRATDAVVTVHAGAPGPVDSVDPDLVEAMALVARHLVVMGRSRPVLLGLDRFPGGESAMAAALRAAGLTAETFPGSELRYRRDGADAAAALLARVPGVDAVVCGSDEVALGLLSALAEHPGAGADGADTVAVIGFDNLDDGRFSTPSLTTVDLGGDRLARATLDLLTDRLSGLGDATPRRLIQPVNLIRRESTLGTLIS